MVQSRQLKYPNKPPVKNVKVRVPLPIQQSILVTLAVVLGRFACNKVFSRFNKLVQSVVARAKQLKFHVTIVVARGSLKKTKNFPLKYLLVSILVIAFA